MPTLHGFVLVGFAALLLVAAYTDLRRFEIPNVIPILLVVLYPLFIATASTLPHFWIAISIAAFTFAAGVALFAAGLLGGGDVKLLAAVSLWVEPVAFSSFLTLTAAAGGVLGICLLTRPGAALAGRFRAPGLDVSKVASGFRRPMPYGIAIAAAGLVVVLPFHF